MNNLLSRYRVKSVSAIERVNILKANNQKQVVNDALMGLVVAIIGVLYLVSTLNLREAAIGNAYAPRYFPMLISLILIITGITFVIKNGAHNVPVAMKNFMRSFIEDKEVNLTIMVTCIGSIIYALIFRKVGFVISTFLFLNLLLFLTRKERIIANSVIAAIFSITVYVVFSKLLGVTLPSMPFINF